MHHNFKLQSFFDSGGGSCGIKAISKTQGQRFGSHPPHSTFLCYYVVISIENVVKKLKVI